MADDLISRADALALVAENSTVSAIRAIRSLPAAQAAVKPLEWRHVAPHGFYEAYGLCWKYQIRVGTDGIIRWQDGHMGTWLDADSVDAAKAAAQADYAARILPALA